MFDRCRNAAALILVLLIATPAAAKDWTVPGHFPTIQAAVDSALVEAGDRIFVGPGDHAGAHVMKAVEIKGTSGARIVGGPLHPAGLVYGFLVGAAADGTGGDGVTISHLTFTVDFPVFSRGANDVTVSHNTVHNALQGVTNRGGSRWDVSHNVFQDLRTNCGGGIAIMIGDHQGGDVQDNVIAHNRISGTVHVAADDCGGYQATGIVLYADFRFGFIGASSIAFNRVVKNSIGLASDNAALVDVVAVELTDTSDSTTIVRDNAIGFNDLRSTTLQIALAPAGLEDVNTISRNLGDNRGHGVHPSAFK